MLNPKLDSHTGDGCKNTSCENIYCRVFDEVICIFVQANTCYIDNMCRVGGELNPQDARWACKPGITQEQWSVIGSKLWSTFRFYRNLVIDVYLCIPHIHIMCVYIYIYIYT